MKKYVYINMSIHLYIIKYGYGDVHYVLESMEEYEGIWINMIKMEEYMEEEG